MDPHPDSPTVIHHNNMTFKALPNGYVIKIGPDNKPREFIRQHDTIVGISITFDNCIMLETKHGLCHTIKTYNIDTGRCEGTIEHGVTYAAVAR